MLTLAEKLMLLGLNDEKGSIIFSVTNSLNFGLAGALLLDLYYCGDLKYENETVAVNNQPTTSLPFLEDAFKILQGTEKKKDIKFWINKFVSDIELFKEKILNNLVKKDILKKEEKKVLWMFNVDRYPTLDPVPELNIRKKVREFILNDELIDPKLITLVRLIDATELEYELFDEKERHFVKERLAVINSKDYLNTHLSQMEIELLNEVFKVIKESYSSTVSN